MSAVWANGPANKTELLVLLALADNADDTGKCWPSYQTIADKSRVSKRHAMRIINKLCNDGYLSKKKRYKKGDHTSNMYQIDIEKIGSDTVSLVTDNVTRGSDTHVTRVVTPMSPKPSVNRKFKTSIEVPPELNTEEFLAVWSDWVQYRKESKKPLKPTTISRQLNRLKKHPPEVAAAMLDQSIENQWQGIFELKNPGVVHSKKVLVNNDGSINV